ncbi:hypothetical protein [Enterocloster bolteae]|jgi:hypothetical protein|uniref:Uncharacterized protein n=1 Tax=Enterocloster bolteae 90B8 TaxID=997897 RepID=R0B982_9FIRM|nr:hypothetical protein [Enterocloster bolteae]ENZ45233.1 hypothetical protein HMPREF1097_00067 [Enterocloster bolteae 90B8]
MASLNGITVKGLKSTEGPESIVWTGKLYLNDVIIGVWSNDYYGGSDYFELLPGYDEEKLKEQIYGKYPDCDLISADIFMGRLVDLTIEEQLFCKVVGNSGGLLLSINDGYHGIHIDLPREYGGLSDEEILKKEAELIYNSRKMLLLQSEGGIHKIKIYRKTEEFCVGSPIMLDAIREN